MSENVDYTDFWLAWRATCAIDYCTNKRELKKKCEEYSASHPESKDEYAKLLNNLDGVINLSEKVQGEYGSIALKSLYSRSEFIKRDLGDRAFSLLEGYLYNKGEIKGRPFKQYLYEDRGTREGGLAKNIHGYLMYTLETMFRDSCAKKYIQYFNEFIKDDDSDKEDSPETYIFDSKDDSSASDPSNDMIQNNDVASCIEAFKAFVEANEKKWDNDAWYCLKSIFENIPLADVITSCRRGKSALNDLRTKIKQEMIIELKSTFCNNGYVADLFLPKIIKIINEHINSANEAEK